MTILTAMLVTACNPFSGEPDPSSGDQANLAARERAYQEASERTAEAPPAELIEVGLQQAPEDSENPELSEDTPPAAQPDPTAVPTAEPAPPDTAPGTADDARNLVWAYLSQCISIDVDDLEARQVQGEWFVQAAGESPDQLGLWKVDSGSGLVLAHNIRARQWEPLFNQNCTSEQFSEFFTPTPSPLGNPEVMTAEQAATTLWATLVNCYPNMESTDLQATLNRTRSEWIVTAHIEIGANYGVWAVASDGAVSPKNRQAQGVFEQLDSGLC